MQDYGFFDFLGFLGSFAIFIFGLKKMSESFQKVAGNDLRKILSYITTNSFLGILSGFTLTAVIQSSSATTTLIIGVVNAGLLTAKQSIGLIIGANIGTTVTGWLVSLIGYQLKFSNLILPVLGISVPLIFSGVRKWKSIADVIIGFCFMFLGLSLMKENVPKLGVHTEFLNIIESISHYGFFSLVLFAVIGFLLTIIVQSSSVSISLTIVFLTEGWVSFDFAAAMVLGANIGTTTTALLASVIGNSEAKRSAMAHVIFNTVGVLFALMAFDFLTKSSLLFTKEVLTVSAKEVHFYPLSLSVFHTLFNTVNAILFVWFIPQLNRGLSRWFTKDSSDKPKLISSSNIIDTPELALLEVNVVIEQISLEVKSLFAVMKAQLFGLGKHREQDEFRKIIKGKEQALKSLEFETTEFLKELTQTEVSFSSSNKIVFLLAVLNEFEQIRLELNRMQTVYQRKEITYTEFKPGVEKGLYELFNLVEKAFETLHETIKKGDLDQLSQAEEIELEIMELRDELRLKQMKRLKNKKEGIGTGLLFRELNSSMSKVSGHIYVIYNSLKRQNEL